MKTLLFATAVVLGTCGMASAQCPNCTPKQPVSAAPSQGEVPAWVVVRQRRGLFGWRCRYVLVRTDGQPQPVAPVWFVR